jgi:hypothetical protein
MHSSIVKVLEKNLKNFWIFIFKPAKLATLNLRFFAALVMSPEIVKKSRLQTKLDIENGQ